MRDPGAAALEVEAAMVNCRLAYPNSMDQKLCDIKNPAVKPCEFHLLVPDLKPKYNCKIDDCSCSEMAETISRDGDFI